MPGFFGGVGEVAGSIERLSGLFGRVWQPVQEVRFEGGRLGGHAFEGDAVSSSEERATAWDGDFGVFGNLGVEAGEGVAGVSAEVEGSRLRAVLQTDPSGAFPLFYQDLGAGLIFSTHLKPLASALEASPNLAAISQYLRFGYIHAGETVFEGIRRLQPGQRLEWSAESGSRLIETSRLWTDVREFASPEEAAEEISPLLRASMDQVLRSADPGVLMMSAGWDSRTLLAAVDGLRDAGLLAYSHGDTASRELRIAREICETLAVPWRGESIAADVWDLDHLDSCFRRTESLVFPHWGRSGTLLAGQTTCAFSGVLGEVLGGHWGETHVSSGLLGKGASLIRSLRTRHDGVRSPAGELERDTILDRFLLSRMTSPWYLRPEVEGDSRNVMTRINERIHRDFARLEGRGISSPELLLEAAITETKGFQYVCAQPLSMRMSVDISMPFARSDLLEAASRIPASLKVHNRVNRKVVRRLCPELERFPMAATLVPASWPLLIQEGSRAVRRLFGDSAWALHRRTQGRVPHPRFGWVNFDFLRSPGLLESVFDSLSLDIWDRRAFDRVAGRIRNGADFQSLHPLYDQTGKILTVDRMLRTE